MTILTSLARAYECIDGAPDFGYSLQKVGFVISLNPDGTVANVTDMRQRDIQPRMLAVPQPEKRTRNIAPNFLWDNTAYVLGVTAEEGKRTADKHAAFVDLHLDDLSNATDEGMLALRAFLKAWNPDHFVAHLWPDEMKDKNIIFALESEHKSHYLHDRPAAKELWEKRLRLKRALATLFDVSHQAKQGRTRGFTTQLKAFGARKVQARSLLPSMLTLINLMATARALMLRYRNIPPLPIQQR